LAASPQPDSIPIRIMTTKMDSRRFIFSTLDPQAVAGQAFAVALAVAA
jgi:hypothetical protein